MKEDELDVSSMDINKQKVLSVFDVVKNLTMIFIRYHNRGESSYCNLPKQYCNSKTTVIIQNTEHS